MDVCDEPEFIGLGLASIPIGAMEASVLRDACHFGVG